MNGGDIHDAPLFTIVRRHGDALIDRLGRRLRYRMLRMPASDNCGDGSGARTTWGEWQIECRDGQTSELQPAWDHLLHENGSSVIDELTREEALLWSVAAAWNANGDEQGLADDPVVAPDLILAAIVGRLRDRQCEGRSMRCGPSREANAHVLKKNNASVEVMTRALAADRVVTRSLDFEDQGARRLPVLRRRVSAARL